VRDKLLWFSLGAVAASAVFAIAGWRFTALTQPVAGTNTPIAAELPALLARIDSRLAALESRAAKPGDRVGVSTEAPVESPRSAPTPAARRSLEESTEVVTRAIGAGVWTSADAAELRTASAGLSGDDHMALVRQIVVAINEDRLKVEPGADLP
jgi:hypothetical protein